MTVKMKWLLEKLLKIVYKGIPIDKFVGLKSKMYFMLSDDGKESNTAK